LMTKRTGFLAGPAARAAADLAHEFLARHGLLALGWAFAFNDRRMHAGFCDEEVKTIYLSSYFVESNPFSDVRDTLLHEIAHALVGCRHGHGPAWKAKCLELGCTPSRLCQAAMPPGRWRAACPGCAATFSRHRRPKVLTGYCSDCGPERGPVCWAPHRPRPC
jgi:hypothetical protein